MKKNTKTLEICCYIICLGAFGIFFRWMQLMLAYDDNSLVGKSFWNVAVILLLAGAAFVAIRFVKQYQDKYYYLPHDFCQALHNDSKLHNIFRWSVSGFVIVGALLLLMECEIDKNANFYRVLAVATIVSGLCFGLLLSAANRPAVLNRNFVSFLASVPIIMMAIWTITLYKVNSINPVSWDYATELFAVLVSMLAFFRVAGFAFGVENEWRSLFFCILGAVSCMANLANDRYLGYQVMFAGVAMMQILYVWIMLDNMKKGQPVEKDISI